MEAIPSIFRQGNVPAVSGLESEKAAFKRLQETLSNQFELVFPDKLAPKTVVIIPSLTLDAEILDKIAGVNYYEERLLCLLLLLRMPRTRVVYVTSMPIDPAIVDYYLHLLPGITTYHARQRLTLLSCYDASPVSLTEKILSRPRLLQRLRECIGDRLQAHMACFNVTEAERRLAVALQIPIFGCDPDLQQLGDKTNSRKIFRNCGVPTPLGFEDLYTKEQIMEALVKLKQQMPGLRKAVVKLNEGFSGDGNAIFSYAGTAQGESLYESIEAQLNHQLQTVASEMPVDQFLAKMQQTGGVAEAFIEGESNVSPSVQCRITPNGDIEIVSTHDQLLGGSSGQVYLGASFPANAAYAPAIGDMGKTIATHLRSLGVMGRFAIDFISVRNGGAWSHYAIEINLRKGGTTHPYLLLEFLTNGRYHAEEGVYYAANGQARYYVCSDNLKNEKYKGLSPQDLIDIAMCNDLLYDGSSQEGVMFHLISALSQFGKLGVLCVGATPERADFFYRKTVDVLDKECA